MHEEMVSKYNDGIEWFLYYWASTGLHDLVVHCFTLWLVNKICATFPTNDKQNLNQLQLACVHFSAICADYLHVITPINITSIFNFVCFNRIISCLLALTKLQVRVIVVNVVACNESERLPLKLFCYLGW